MAKRESSIISRKADARVWNGKHQTSPVKKSPTAGKVMVTLSGILKAFSGTGLIDEECTLHWEATWQAEDDSEWTPRTTVTRCCVVAWQCLSHTATHTVRTFQRLHSEVLQHTPYSPDLVPSHDHLFGRLKNVFQEAVLPRTMSWRFAAWPETFLSEGLEKLVQRWTKCVENKGKKAIFLWVQYHVNFNDYISGTFWLTYV
jgi:hypothetical protein